MLDGDHPARGKAAAVARTVYFIKNGHLGIAGAQEIGVKGVAGAIRIHCARCSDKRLGDHLSAKDSLDPLWRRDTAKDIFLDLFQIEQRQQPRKRGVRHVRSLVQ
jgi:hypothetical protein